MLITKTEELNITTHYGECIDDDGRLLFGAEIFDDNAEQIAATDGTPDIEEHADQLYSMLDYRLPPNQAAAAYDHMLLEIVDSVAMLDAREACEDQLDGEIAETMVKFLSDHFRVHGSTKDAAKFAKEFLHTMAWQNCVDYLKTNDPKKLLISWAAVSMWNDADSILTVSNLGKAHMAEHHCNCCKAFNLEKAFDDVFEVCNRHLFDNRKFCGA